MLSQINPRFNPFIHSFIQKKKKKLGSVPTAAWLVKRERRRRRGPAAPTGASRSTRKSRAWGRCFTVFSPTRRSGRNASDRPWPKVNQLVSFRISTEWTVPSLTLIVLKWQNVNSLQATPSTACRRSTACLGSCFRWRSSCSTPSTGGATSPKTTTSPGPTSTSSNSTESFPLGSCCCSAVQLFSNLKSTTFEHLHLWKMNTK